jgi:ADP-dependent phosphofructokinase/glucokinase
VHSKEAFDKILEITKKSGIHFETTFGGHAPHMALRASKENCEAILVAGIGKDERDQLTKLDKNHKITFAIQKDEESDESDIHLILEYDAEEYKGLKPPRACRFYANHDVRSPNLATLDHYHSTAQEMGITKHALAGFQLMQALGKKKAIARILEVEKKWKDMRDGERYGPKNFVHVEMAAFANKDIFECFVNHLALNADSIGINEQELQILHTYLSTNVFSMQVIIFRRLLVLEIHCHLLNLHLNNCSV